MVWYGKRWCEENETGDGPLEHQATDSALGCKEELIFSFFTASSVSMELNTGWDKGTRDCTCLQERICQIQRQGGPTLGDIRRAERRLRRIGPRRRTDRYSLSDRAYGESAYKYKYDSMYNTGMSWQLLKTELE
jgi:hypothetical protein